MLTSVILIGFLMLQFICDARISLTHSVFYLTHFKQMKCYPPSPSEGALTWERALSQVTVELADRVTEAVEDTEFVTGRDYVDVADLLRLWSVVLIFWHHPQPASTDITRV